MCTHYSRHSTPVAGKAVSTEMICDENWTLVETAQLITSIRRTISKLARWHLLWHGFPSCDKAGCTLCVLPDLHTNGSQCCLQAGTPPGSPCWCGAATGATWKKEISSAQPKCRCTQRPHHLELREESKGSGGRGTRDPRVLGLLPALAEFIPPRNKAGRVSSCKNLIHWARLLQH